MGGSYERGTPVPYQRRSLSRLGEGGGPALAAAERGGNNFKGLKGLVPESQRQNLALTVLCVNMALTVVCLTVFDVPSSLGNGPCHPAVGQCTQPRSRTTQSPHTPTPTSDSLNPEPSTLLLPSRLQLPSNKSSNRLRAARPCRCQAKEAPEASDSPAKFTSVACLP